ncbi:MAG TPA: hypothetical protein PK545_06215, partial [Deltaproteobacteria bacterium]|nr:hypothetical protein [Deltaproteobacteria bacterium]
MQMKRTVYVLGPTLFLLLAPLQVAPGQSPRFLRGDADASGKIEVTDAIFVLGYLFLGDRAPTCLDAADANDTGDLDISDPIFVLSWLFLGGRSPPAPGLNECGSDPTADGLSCIYFEPCAPATSETEALMVLVEYESMDGLVNFMFECQERGIKPAVLSKGSFVAEHCQVFKMLQMYGLEIIGWCGPVLWGMSYAEQRDLARWTKDTIEACTGSPLKAIGTRLFGTDVTTCRIAEELGIPYVFARGTTGTRATVYKPAEH